MSNTIDLSTLLSPVEAPTKRTKAPSAPSVPSLTLPTTDRPSLLTLTGLTKSTSRALFDLMREQAQSATTDTTIYMTTDSRAVMHVSCSAKATKRAKATLDTTEATEALFTWNAPKRDTTRNDTNAFCAMPTTARLVAVLLSHLAPLTQTRSLIVCLDSKRALDNAVNVIIPNTHDPLVCVVAVVVALRPACDALALKTIHDVCDALALPRPTLA